MSNKVKVHNNHGVILRRSDNAKVGSIYISGPMRGYDKFNFPAFYNAEKILKKIGVSKKIINPARIDEEGNYTNSPNFQEFIVRDLFIMFKNKSGLVLLDGWEDSEGVGFELKAAKIIGTPAITLEHAIVSGSKYVNELFGEVK